MQATKGRGILERLPTWTSFRGRQSQTWIDCTIIMSTIQSCQIHRVLRVRLGGHRLWMVLARTIYKWSLWCIFFKKGIFHRSTWECLQRLPQSCLTIRMIGCAANFLVKKIVPLTSHCLVACVGFSPLQPGHPRFWICWSPSSPSCLLVDHPFCASQT